MALITSLVTFGISIAVLAQFDPANPDLQLVVNLPWIQVAGWNIAFHLGVDGLSILLVLLTTFLTPISILSTWTAVEERVKDFMIFFLLLEVGMVGVFLAQDLFLFYIFWEFTLVPMYFLIGIWGGPRRMYAAIKFFLYTMAGSILMLLAILWLGINQGTFSVPELIAKGGIPAEHPILAVPGLCGCLCHQGAHVAAALLAAGCPRGSAHGRLGHPGGCPAEDGHLWLPALQPAALPAGSRAAGALDGRPGGDWHHVRRGWSPMPRKMSRSWLLIPRSATWVLSCWACLP